MAHFDGVGFIPTSVFDGTVLRPGHAIVGPAIVERMGDSVVIPPGFEAGVDSYLTLLIGRVQSSTSAGVTRLAGVTA
jgi:N-methylhydantoinase A/oxoprolinase/acetone carboxylase beta subunit